MVLDHIPQGTGAIIVAAPVANPQLLRYRDLHMVNIGSVPQWLHQGVCKTESHNILYRLFTQVMVYPVDLLFGKDAGQQLV